LQFFLLTRLFAQKASITYNLSALLFYWEMLFNLGWASFAALESG